MRCVWGETDHTFPLCGRFWWSGTKWSSWKHFGLWQLCSQDWIQSVEMMRSGSTLICTCMTLISSSLTEARPLRKIKNGSVKRPELMVRTHLFIHLLSELDWIIEWNDGQHFRREKHVARQQINKAIGLKAARKQNKLKWINEDVSVSSCSLSVCRSKNETRSLNLYRWRTSLCSSHVGKLLLIIYM